MQFFGIKGKIPDKTFYPGQHTKYKDSSENIKTIPGFQGILLKSQFFKDAHEPCSINTMTKTTYQKLTLIKHCGGQVLHSDKTMAHEVQVKIV